MVKKEPEENKDSKQEPIEEDLEGTIEELESEQPHQFNEIQQQTFIRQIAPDVKPFLETEPIENLEAELIDVPGTTQNQKSPEGPIDYSSNNLDYSENTKGYDSNGYQVPQPSTRGIETPMTSTQHNQGQQYTPKPARQEEKKSRLPFQN